jgi:hypothetical protein
LPMERQVKFMVRGREGTFLKVGIFNLLGFESTCR